MESLDTLPWRSRGEAMQHAQDMGEKLERPICTGLSVYAPASAPDHEVADDEPGAWVIRVELHSMTEGDSSKIVRCPLDVRDAYTEVYRIQEANKAAIIADRAAMNAAYEAQQQQEQEQQQAQATKESEKGRTDGRQRRGTPRGRTAQGTADREVSEGDV